jgi:hypothetical protein
MAIRNRIIYASQSVWVNGQILYRIQSLGSTTSFTSEDVFEIGHLDIIDVVDDVPAVAITLNSNDFGDLKTLATLAQIASAKIGMTVSGTIDNANLKSGSTYLHGVSMADFAVTCGNLTGVTMWAPVQSECDLGTLADNIDQTLFLDEVYVNSLEFSYTTGANATENYGAETDNKTWLLNDGRFVNYFDVTVTSGIVTAGYIDLVADASMDTDTVIPTLSTGNIGFLRKNTDGAPAVTLFDESLTTSTNIEVTIGVASANTTFVYHAAEQRLYLPDVSPLVAAADQVQIVIAADKYSTPVNNYFDLLEATERPNDIGALRQGQVEIYIVDPDSGSSFDNAWRLTGATVSADLTREPLTELGHLGPYDRPLTLPIPLTVTIDSTAGDLRNWAKIAGHLEEYDLDPSTLDDIDLTDLMNKENLILVVKVYKQTDEEAGGTCSSRKALTIYDAAGDTDWYMDDGVPGNYSSTTDTERSLKTIVVKNLKITDEGMTLDVGANATQTFGFRANNDLFVVKGDVSYSLISAIARNAS